MKRTVFALGMVAALAALLATGPAAARGRIETACLGSERAAASRNLCSCIQKVADAVLSSGEQRRGAKFFAEPHLSQEAKASDRRADERFWEKWETFAAGAVKYCQ